MNNDTRSELQVHLPRLRGRPHLPVVAEAPRFRRLQLILNPNPDEWEGQDLDCASSLRCVPAYKVPLRDVAGLRSRGCRKLNMGGGGTRYSFIACLSHLTIGHASPSRRSTVPTPNTPPTFGRSLCFLHILRKYIYILSLIHI